MLIAESGSTKTEWRVCENGKVIDAFRTSGCNPRVQSPEMIERDIQDAFDHHLAYDTPEKIYFYGAGLGAHRPREVMGEILHKLLPASTVFIEHDMLAAARSTRRKEGIVCILGTGSNSCYHKNFQEVAHKGGLGYIIGDEGAGADLGKYLLKGFLQGELPSNLKEKFENIHHKKVQDILTSLMLSPKPNVVMASWAEFVHQHLTEPTIKEMVVSRFIAFLDTSVCLYPNYANLYVDFVGSIAHYFSEQLTEACVEKEIILGEINKDPIEKLVDFHLNELI